MNRIGTRIKPPAGVNIAHRERSVRIFRTVFLGLLGILVLLAVYITVFKEFPDRYEPFDFASFSSGVLRPSTTIWPYGGESETFATIHPDDRRGSDKFLRLQVHSGDGEWFGIGMEYRRTLPSDAVFTIEWRGTVRNHQILIDISDGKGENFYIYFDSPGESWTTVSIPVHTLKSNPTQSPDIEPTGIFEYENVRSISFTFFPGTEAVLDIGSITFEWRSGQVSAVLIVAFLLIGGIVFWLRTSPQHMLTAGEWDLRSGAMTARVAFVLFTISTFAALARYGDELLTPASILVHVFYFAFIAADDFFNRSFSIRTGWPWRYVVVLIPGWYFGFSDDPLQLACLLGIAFLPMIQQRSAAISMSLPVIAVAALFVQPELGLALTLPAGIVVIGMLTIFSILVKELIGHIEQRRESRHAIALYEQAFEHTTEAILTVDKSGAIERTNNGFRVLTGLDDEQITGRPLAEFILPEDRPLLASGVQLAEENAAQLLELRIADAEGAVRSLLVRKVPLFRNELFLGYQVICTDVTEFRKLERQLHQSQRMESLGTLAGGVAHDFNNILCSILGFASFLKKSIPEHHTFYKPLDRIEKSSQRAAELTRKLLSFSRGGHQEVKQIDVNAVVTETVSMLKGGIDSSITIQTYLDEPLHPMVGDAGQIQQVIMNLCVNARDAMPDGGKLLIETSHSRVDENFVKMHVDARVGRYIVVSVSDTGIGMDKKTKERIFDPFFTTKEKDKGTGLGLSMVHGIVRSHDGIIRVYSEPGKGSIFRVYFPVNGMHTHDETVQSDDAAVRLSAVGGGCVLVVDDEEYMRDLAKDILEHGNYRVLLAEDGEEALSIYRESGRAIDLVILDLTMPNMSGRDTFLKLKAMNPSITVLLSSGYSEKGNAREVMEAGAMGFLRKPYTASELEEEVRMILNIAPQLSTL